MVEGSNGWFGAQSTNVAVAVTGTAPDANVYFIHTDHLNTPRLVANSAGTTVWRWDQQEPFGINVPDENPSGLGAFEFALRYPGQYTDKETNLHYNYFRDYDPSIGRYAESDPIGLRGGLNTYAYVKGRPLTLVDLRGLQDKENELSPLPGDEPSGFDPMGSSTVVPPGTSPAYLTCYITCLEDEAFNLGSKVALACGGSAAAIGIGTAIRLADPVKGLIAGGVVACACVAVTGPTVASIINNRCRRKCEGVL
jgi:RHS repeat-associated protein